MVRFDLKDYSGCIIYIFGGEEVRARLRIINCLGVS